MKRAKNGSLNSFRFLLENINFLNAEKLSFRQVGSKRETQVAVSNIVTDCFTCLIEFVLLGNQLQNGIYTAAVLDGNGVVLQSTTCEINGHDNSDNFGFVILESQIGTIPPSPCLNSVGGVNGTEYNDNGLWIDSCLMFN